MAIRKAAYVKKSRAVIARRNALRQWVGRRPVMKHAKAGKLKPDAAIGVSFGVYPVFRGGALFDVVEYLGSSTPRKSLRNSTAA